MGKVKTVFVCSTCGHNVLKWEGCCPNCGEWNTLKEAISKKETIKVLDSANFALPLKKIDLKYKDRYDLGIDELNILFGGGIVKGSISLIGGDPGIGKSTLLLQVCSNLALKEKVLYVSGEENVSQIKLRANRLKIDNDNLLILSESDVYLIIEVIKKENPKIVVIDSIQTMKLSEIDSVCGSVAQVRESTNIFQKIAKSEDISIVLVGHVNKEGNIAGPKVLEHVVDTVLYFEGNSKNQFRILRVVKNRFGSINEIAVFEMKEEGLSCVVNPCSILIDERPKNVSGSAICAVMKGKKPLFAEIQSLTSKSFFGIPRRLSKGLDYNKLIIIVAVLEKRVGFSFQNLDCYVNVVGGVDLKDPACDLAVALSLVAALKDLSINEEMIILGEIGLSGEVRSVSGVEKTILEAEKLGFSKIILPYNNLKNLKKIKTNVELIGVKTVKAAVCEILK